MNPILLNTLDYCYGLTCKHCKKKVLDPDKLRKQKYLDDNCPYCGKNGLEPVQDPEESN